MMEITVDGQEEMLEAAPDYTHLDHHHQSASSEEILDYFKLNPWGTSLAWS